MAPGSLEVLPYPLLNLRCLKRPEKTRECLRSLRSTTYSNYSVLLVDNGSENQDGKVLAAEFSEVELLSLDKNYGFAGGCNRGLAFAMARGADFIWLLNNDASAEPRSIELLVTAAKANQKAAALGVIVIEGDSSKAEEAGIGEINFKRAKTFLRRTAGKASTLSCQWLSGSNLLLRAEALRQVGLFDERYFLYFEDVDLCHRLVMAGYECLLVPGSTIVHEGNASTPGGLSLWRSYYHTRNRLLFFMQYSKGTDRLLALISIGAHFLRHCFSLPFKGNKGRARLKAEWLGLRDYCQGHLGRADCLDWCEKVQF